MAAVYAALLSLARSLHQILDLQQHIDPVHREKIVYLYEKVDFIVNFLEDYSDKYHATLDRVGNGIRKAAYEAQDFMDSYMFLVWKTNGDSSSSEADGDKVSLDRDLNMALERIDFIWEESIKMKNNDKAEDVPSRTYSSSVGHSSAPNITTRNMTVGLDDDLNNIKERLYEDSDELQIIPIVGMGGIGKTTLAKRAYEDSLRAQYFDFCAWITLSANYQRREILSGLLKYFKKPDAKDQFDDQSEAHLATLVYQNLVGRRYLIVIDDIWSTKAWDDLKMIFPDDGSGSRILLTTRLLDVAVHSTSSSSPLHQMNFLNEDQSWKLLQERTFGRESCPLALMEIGKKIARSCGGLPLTIVVVAGLLSISNLTKQKVWENISENISSAEPTITLHCSKILGLSYDSLPLRLKPCFLYIATFPEDSQIDVSRLIKLWVAEGFLKRPHDQCKCLEDVGEWCLEDLVNRSLILVSQKGPDGRLETIGIHDLLREICIKKAEEEGFLYHFSFKRKHRKDAAIENPARRLSIYYPSTSVELQTTNPSIRSLLLFSNIYFTPRLSICCWNLNVLDAPAVFWSRFSNVISTFVNLRYIAFTLDLTLPLTGFPASISKHPNLQTIIVYTKMNGLRILWGMPKLRHLIMNTSFHLSYPSDIGIVHGSDLQTLETVINFRFTEEAIKMLMNLKKLKAEFDMYQHEWEDFNLNNLFRLQNLVELQVTMGGSSSDSSMIWNHAFPVSLKKLSLHGVSFPWGNMTIIGSLPNLQVLEMINVRGNEVSEWKPTEGQFLRLKYFYSSLDDLVKWEVEKEHFSSLEILILMNVVLIHEIPLGIGEIDSLQLIELQHCRESLKNSAKQIEKQQHENGNDAFQVRFIVSDDFFHLKID